MRRGRADDGTGQTLQSTLITVRHGGSSPMGQRTAAAGRTRMAEGHWAPSECRCCYSCVPTAGSHRLALAACCWKGLSSRLGWLPLHADRGLVPQGFLIHRHPASTASTAFHRQPTTNRAAPRSCCPPAVCPSARFRRPAQLPVRPPRKAPPGPSCSAKR